MQNNSQGQVVQALDSPEIPNGSSPPALPIAPTAEVPQDQRRETAIFSETPIMVPLNKLYPHPQNPRIVPGEHIIEQIRASLVRTGRFDPAYAPIVRPWGDGYRSWRGIDVTKQLAELA